MIELEWGDCRDFPNRPAYGLAKKLADYSYYKHNFESDDIDLYVMTLIQAGKDVDIDWMMSDICECYCAALMLPYQWWLQACMNIWLGEGLAHNISLRDL